jgi:hypothetical protein
MRVATLYEKTLKDEVELHFPSDGQVKNSKISEWRITKDKYEEKRKEYRAKQREIKEKMNKLHFADEECYLTSEYLLKLAFNAGKLFESSEVYEKRLLLKLTLQNLELKGKKVRFTWLNPFDKIAFYASRQDWLPGLVSQSVLLWDGVRLEMKRIAKGHTRISLLSQRIAINEAPLYASAR